MYQHSFHKPHSIDLPFAEFQSICFAPIPIDIDPTKTITLSILYNLFPQSENHKVKQWSLVPMALKPFITAELDHRGG